MLRYLLVAVFFNILFVAQSQYYDIGQEPSNIEWKQINTENFKIIFPDNYQSEALKTAILFEEWRLPVSASLKVKPPYTPVVLHTGSVYSNAFTVWAPRRLEFLTIPPQDIYGQPWNEQLVLHEYRHMAQISKINQGFTRTLGYILGQQAAPGIIGLFVPPWFMEGDAVGIETGLSNSGRGRMADFAMPLKAQLKGKGPYTYTKAVLGSYKDFTPDHYILGYHLVAVGRYQYGTDIWNIALDRTGRKPYTFNPFSKGMKLVAGTKKRGFYNSTVKMLDSLWRQPAISYNYKQLPVMPQKTYSNYVHPYYVGDKVIALKSSLSEIHKFVEIDNEGEEKIIYTPGYLFDDELSYNGTYISWAERRPHARWQNQGYSSIVLLNPQSGEVIKIKTTKRVFSPSVDKEGRLIVTSEVNTSGEYFLTFLDLAGRTVKQVPSLDNMFISSPSWSPDSREVVCVLTGKKGKQLVIYTFSDSSFKPVTGFISDELSNPQHYGSRIIFNMDIAQVSEVCSLDLSSGNISLITRSQFGTKHPHFNSLSDKMLFATYTSNGYRIAEANSSEFLNEQVTGENNHWPLAEILSKQEAEMANTSSSTDSLYVSDYKKSSHLFNFHSWAPAYVDIDDQSVRPGFSLMSQNLLSTLFVTTGYDYNLDEETGQWRADVSYRGWYPVINSSISYGKRASWEGSGDTAYRFTWQETTWDLGISQWLSSFAGRYTYGTLLQVKHQLLNSRHNAGTPHYFREGTIGVINYRVYASLFEKSAYRDLAPRTGITFDFRFKNSVYGDFSAGYLFSTQTRIYMPGLFKNHSLQLYGAYQQIGTITHGNRFAGDISIPAGFGVRTPDEIIRIRPSYSLPLFYPDFSIGTAYYLKRLRGSAFYDYAFTLNEVESKTFTSIGADIVTDFHILALPAPLSAGVRSAWLPEIKEWNFSLIFSFDFTQY